MISENVLHMLREFGPLKISGVKFRLHRAGIKISTCALQGVLLGMRSDGIVGRKRGVKGMLWLAL